MMKVFSTSALHPRDRFDCWHSVACLSVVDHECVPVRRDKFVAELRFEQLAETGVVSFANSPMSISHTERHIATRDANQIFICQQIEGHLAIEQGNREARLGPGDLTLLDPSLPYRGRFFEGSKLLVLKTPRRLLEMRTGKIRQLTARPIKPSAGESTLLSRFLESLRTQVSCLQPSAQEVVQNQVLDLTAISVSQIFGTNSRVSDARSLALAKIHMAIETRLSEPDLDTEKVAAAAGISIRYANKVLAEYDTSIRRAILDRRLVHCRQALEDSSQSHRTLGDIAFGWGFSDLTHFGRTFKSAYGASPSDYRKSCHTA